MAVQPVDTSFDRPRARLGPFDPRHAALVASWVRTPGELYWLAPRTPPPLNAAAVLEWICAGRRPYVLHEENGEAPAGYGEVNPLNGGAGVSRGREYWLGHIIIAPPQRGRGLGLVLTRLLIETAFEQAGAAAVSLVVFPTNVAAIRCYRAAGMRACGYETHYFAAHRRRAQLLKMVIRRS